MYLSISIFVLIISIILFRRFGAPLRPTRLNMISFIFWYYLVAQSFIASILVIYDIDNHYVISRVAGDKARLYGWLSVMWTMIALPIGFSIGSIITGNKYPSKIFEQ